MQMISLEREIFSDVENHVLSCVDLKTELEREKKRREASEIEQDTLRAALDQALAEVAALKASAQRAHHLARHDSLTSLPNGTYFRECLDKIVGNARALRQTMAVLYLDVDGFKTINDTHGHAIGDAVLRIVGARLSRALRAEDLVGRLGGDEFACLVSGFQSRDQVQRLITKLIDSVAATERVRSHDLEVRISVGVALYPHDGTDTEALLSRADEAMYHAKKYRLGCAFSDELRSARARAIT